jgi:hypothetical protein
MTSMELAAGEKLVSEIELGTLGGSMTLTNRRVVASVELPSSGLESVSLAQIGGVRAAHVRSIKRIVQGAGWIVLALIVLFGYRPLENRANGLIAQAEKRITDKSTEVLQPEAPDRLHLPTLVIILVGLPLMVFGAWRVTEGVRGRTELLIICAGGSLSRTRLGRSAALIEFGNDVSLQMAAFQDGD